MNSRLKIAAFITAGFLLIFWNIGCSTNRALYGGANKPALLNKKKLAAYNYTDPGKTNTYYLTVYNDAAAADKEKVRNAILSDLMSMIDYNYHEYENNLRTDNDVKNMIADIVTLGLTASATAVGGAETKTILSAIATGVVGVNTSIDKNVFQSNTIQAIELEMRALRAAKEADLYHGMASTDKQYPLQSGIRDIIAYYYAGSLTDALMGLAQQTATHAQTNQQAANSALTNLLTK